MGLMLQGECLTHYWPSGCCCCCVNSVSVRNDSGVSLIRVVIAESYFGAVGKD